MAATSGFRPCAILHVPPPLPQRRLATQARIDSWCRQSKGRTAGQVSHRRCRRRWPQLLRWAHPTGRLPCSSSATRTLAGWVGLGTSATPYTCGQCGPQMAPASPLAGAWCRPATISKTSDSDSSLRGGARPQRWDRHSPCCLSDDVSVHDVLAYCCSVQAPQKAVQAGSQLQLEWGSHTAKLLALSGHARELQASAATAALST